MAFVFWNESFHIVIEATETKEPENADWIREN